MALRLVEGMAEVSASDADLLARYRNGDLDAFSALYERHRRALCLYAHSLTRDRAAAEDAVQEAFMRLLRYMPAEIRNEVRALLYQIVRHQCLDAARRSVVRRTAFPHLAPRHPERDLDLAETVSRAIDALPDEQRETVILRVYAGLTFEEIAGLHRVPLSTALSRYEYALEKLARCLEDADETR